MDVTQIEVLVDGLDHPEGVAYDHLRGVLYAGGEDGQVYAVDVENGSFAEIARTPGFVLGLAVDGAGRIVVCDSVDGAIGIAFTEEAGPVTSCYRPDRIYYLDPDGALEIIAEDPEGTLLAAPTNVAFVGAGRRTLVSANLGRWHLTRLETDVTGVVPHAPATWAVDAPAGSGNAVWSAG